MVLFAMNRVDTFFDDINREDCFDTLDMDGTTPNYKLVLASDCPNRFNDCIDSDGTLNDSVEIINTTGVSDGLISLLWSKGINGERSCSATTTSTSYTIADNDTSVKAIFLVSYGNGSGYVLAYNIDNVNITVPSDRNLVLPINGAIVNLKYGV